MLELVACSLSSCDNHGYRVYIGVSISSPLGSVDILDQYQTVLRRRFDSAAISAPLGHTGTSYICGCTCGATCM